MSVRASIEAITGEHMQGFSTRPVGEGPLAEVPAPGLRKIRLWGFLIAVGGFLFGFDTGVISGALLFIRSDLQMNSFQQGSVVSVLVLGAMAGALMAGRIADRYGRRQALGMEGVVFLIGTAVAAFSPAPWRTTTTGSPTRRSRGSATRTGASPR